MGKKNKQQQKKKDVPAAKPLPSKKITPTGRNTPGNMTSWLLVLVAILPFLHSEKLIDPAVPIRYLTLGIFTLVFVILFFGIRKRSLPIFPLSVKLVFITGLVFAAWSLISSFSAANPNEGFYIISRHVLNLLFLFIVTYIVIHEESQLIKIAKVLVIAGILQSFIGILQFYDIAFTDLPGNFIPYGLMANRNLFGSAQALLVPFCLLVLQQGNKTWKYVAGFSLLVILISIFFSQTRSAWIATALMFIISIVLVLIFSPENRRKWMMASAAGIIIVIAVIGFLMVSNSNEEFSTSIKQRAASLTSNIADSTSEKQNIDERFKIWKKTIQIIKKNPILGVGPGNWRLAVPSYGTVGMVWEDGYYVPDQPHNDYLHIASETGIPGAVLYFGMWLVIGFFGLQVIIRSSSQENKLTAIIMLAGMTGFASDSMFSFPEERIEHILYLTLMGGIILGLYYNLITKEKVKAQRFPQSFTLLLAALAAFNVFIGIKKYNFEIHMNRAMGYDKAKRYPEVLEEAKAGRNLFITLDPVAKSIQVFSSLAYKEIAKSSLDANDSVKARSNFNMALKEGETARKYNPNSYIVYNNIGTIYTDMSQYDKAVEYYNKALKLTPKFQMSLKNLAVNYYQLQKYKECVQTLEKVNWQEDDYLKSMYNNAKALVNTQKQPTGPASK
jgi:O-antigen ligase